MINLQSTALESVIIKWAYEDFTAAESWVEQLPDGNIRDNAIALLSDAQALPFIKRFEPSAR